MATRRRILDSDPDEAPPPPAPANVVRESPVPPGMLAYGIGPSPEPGETRWLAYCIRDGLCQVLTPKRHERDYGESKDAACARVMEEMRYELPRMGRTPRRPR